MKNPQLVLSLKKVEMNALELKSIATKVFRGRQVDLFYALKANYHPQVLSTLFSVGIGAEVGRLHELEMLSSETSPKILVNGHFKSTAFLEAAVLKQVHRIYVESLNELKRLDDLARRHSRILQVGVRVKVSAEKKVGADSDEVSAISMFKSEFIELSALHFHLGWNVKDPKPADLAMDRMMESLDVLLAEGHPVDTLNFGGSLAEPSSEPGQAYLRLAHFERRLPEVIRKIEIEPGRFYVGDCGILYGVVEEVRGHRAIMNTCAYGYRLTGGTPSVGILTVGSRRSIKGGLILSGHWAAENDILELPEETKTPCAGDIVRFRNFGAYMDTWFDQLNLDRPLKYEFTHPLDCLYKHLEENQTGAGSILMRHWDFTKDEIRSLPKNRSERALLLKAIQEWIDESESTLSIERRLRMIFVDFSLLRRELAEVALEVSAKAQ